jgi:phosphoglycolate phosphatase
LGLKKDNLKKLLLFDIDGTLLRAEDATRQAINETFQSLFNVKESLKDLSFLAWTDLGLFREAAVKLIGRPFNDGEYAVFTKIYTERLQEHLLTCKFYLMPGVAELLPILSAREDIILGLETGNIEPAARLKLERGGISHYFKFGGFGSDSADRAELIKIAIERACAGEKLAIPHKDIYVIGDAPYDVSAARKNGVNTIAVGTGISEQRKVLAEKPDYYLKDLSDMPVFLQCIGCYT